MADWLAPTGSPSNPLLVEHVQATWDKIRPNSAIYNILLSNIRIISAANGRIVAHLPLESVHLNSKRILHGAVSGTLCDWAGGMAIAATGVDKTGVSTDMHLSYVSTAREGDTLEIEAWVSKAGRNLGYTSFEIRKALPEDVEAARPGRLDRRGAVVATGSHTKYLNFGEARPVPLDI
ncbi:HotDog domain-containing protein [Apodospora peruviana]|uniref:HotDog domain-containing protein n=1 Tax=Apodospora peruviana TaxID=516989 RepID=A0AAE0IJ82_9PEZI|nr:HotDog domain-containing protein [Apodospora peruviana]